MDANEVDAKLLDDIYTDSNGLELPLDRNNQVASIQTSSDGLDSAASNIFAPLDCLCLRFESHGSHVSIGTTTEKKSFTKDSRLRIGLVVAVLLVTFIVGLSLGYLFFHSEVLCERQCLKCTASDVCVKCVNPFYAFNGNCIACPINCTECEHKDSLYCSKCEEGFHHGEKHSCPACMNGCKHCKTSSKCNKCFDGWKKEGDKCSFSGLNAVSVVMVGGYNVSNRYGINDLDIISFNDISKCHIPPLPEKRTYPFASTYKQNFIFCGGIDSMSSPRSECWKIKTENRNAIWTSFPHLPLPIMRATLTNINGNLFVVGGATTPNNGQLDSIYIYNEAVQNWTRISKKLTAPTDAHCTLALEHNMIILGGWVELKKASYSHITDNEWTHLPNMTGDRWGHACEIIVHNDEIFIYVAGGQYAPATAEYLKWGHPNSWTMIDGTMNVNRLYFPTLAFLENHLIIIGGAVDIHTTEIFNFQNQTWSYYNVTPSIQQRIYGTSFEISDMSLLNCKT